jgi:cyclic-di-GMP phosphodiesterase TipF (flagellum assembly factor)
MTVIAASAGAVGYFAFGFSGADAVIVAIAVVTGLTLYNGLSTRLNVRSVVGPQLAELARGGADLARQMAELGRRLAAVESKLERSLVKNQVMTEPLTAEISELGALVNQLAETVAMHEAQLSEIALAESEPAESPPPQIERHKIEAGKIEPGKAAPSRIEPLKPPPVRVVAAAEPPAAAPPSEPGLAPPAPAALVVVSPPPAVASPGPAPIAPAVAASVSAELSANLEMLATIRSAIDANRIDVHLQPIVTLPQRKVRYYEAMSRLRTEAGEVVLAARFIAQAETAGLMPKIDNLMVFRCVQVLRRLLQRNREVGVFCNISAATLTDAVVFPQLLEFLEANRAIAPSLVLELTQNGLRSIGPIESESMAALHDCGFQFSLDNVTDLRLEPRELAGRGFRFIKIPANLMLNRSSGASDIHPADLSDLLGRFGIDLIAEKIESEGSVVDLLDYDVKFGQGFLFSPPRPVRAEALQGIGDRNDVVAREGAAPRNDSFGATAGPAQIAPPAAPKSARSAGIAQIARRV